MGASTIAWALVCAQPSVAATSTAAFGVSATVPDSCTVSVAPWASGPVCKLSPRSTIPRPAVVTVRFSRDPVTDALVQTVEF